MDAIEQVPEDGLPLRAIMGRIERNEAFAVAVVIKSEGSTPRAAGTMALIGERGAITGTIGGGLLEAEAQQRGIEVIRKRVPVQFDFSYHGVSAAERDPICGGQMRVLVFPVESGHHTAWRAAQQARHRRERGVFLISFSSAMAWPVRVEFVSETAIACRPDLPDESILRKAIRGERTEMATLHRTAPHSACEVLIVPLNPPPRLLIFGGGHVGQALARLACLLNFDITVIDDRPEFATPDRFPPGVATICGPMDDEAGRIAMGRDTFVAIVTRGHPHDAAVLERCLRRPTAYLGMMGSRRKVALMRREFIESGRATAEEFERIHAPIGLDLGAETVPEIAASIVAQLIAVRRARVGR